jgi:hypothetical protein
MKRRTMFWIVGMAAIAVPIGFASVKGLAEQRRTEAMNHAQAKELADLIRTGQLNLLVATEMAEKHAKGTALDARCEIHVGDFGDSESVRPAKPTKDPSAGKRVIYHVACFADDQLQTVRVDGLTKKIIEDRP